MAAILPPRMDASYCTSGFFRSQSPPINFVKRELPFRHGLKSRTHIDYPVVNHAVAIICADHAKSESTVTHLRT